MLNTEMQIVVTADIARQIFKATADAQPGERIEHHITLIPCGDGFTARLKTTGHNASLVREISPQLNVTASFNVKG